MKKAFFSILTCMLLCTNISAQQKTFNVHVNNLRMPERKNVPVVVDLRKVHFDVRTAVVKLNGKEVPCQLDDMDGDFHYDELVFLADSKANSDQSYKVIISAKGKPRSYQPAVYAHMGLNDKYGKLPQINGIEAPGGSYLFKDVYPHGAEIENDHTAWRIYFDNRQNIDLYGKRTPRLELEKTNFYSTQEDLSAGYGNDILWAGNSMGCGTLREFKNGGPALIDDVALRSERIVAYGPLRTVVEMKDMGWNGNNVKTLYILYAGHREMEIQVESDAPLHHMQLCTGVQKIKENPAGWVNANGLAASWGTDFPDYGKKELYPQETIGLAVYVPEKYMAGTAEDSLQYMCRLKMDKKNRLKYYVTYSAAMEQQSLCKTADEWFANAKRWREEMISTPKIKYFIRLNNN